MASSLLDFPPFDINTDPTSVRAAWKKWIQRSNNFLVAFNIHDEKKTESFLVISWW